MVSADQINQVFTAYGIVTESQSWKTGQQVWMGYESILAVEEVFGFIVHFLAHLEDARM